MLGRDVMLWVWGPGLKTLVVDLDHTICHPALDADQADDPFAAYRSARPNLALIEKLREYHEDGFEIIVHTARNMRTFAGNIEAIEQHTLPLILAWLAEHDVPYDRVVVGKPWCGTEGFYIDDRAIRPREFASLSYAEIVDLVQRDK